MKRRKRFAIVIGLAAAGVMALGVQTASAATYDTKVTITEVSGQLHVFSGRLNAQGGGKCEAGRVVTLFRQKPGADRKLGAVRSRPGGNWRLAIQAKPGWRVYAKAMREVGDGFVCNSDRSPIWPVLGNRPGRH
jgi:hypothetical protein